MRPSKIPLLPPSDLARITIRPQDEQRPLLEQVRGAKVPYTYRPLRKHMPDLVQAATPLYRDRIITPWRTVGKAIVNSSQSMREAIENVRLGKLIYDLATFGCDEVHAVDIRGLTLGLDRSMRDIGGRLTYWSPYVFYRPDGPFIPYFEFRRQRGAESAAARRFVLSMMHHSIREADPDLAEVNVEVVHAAGKRKRSLRFFEDRAVEFFDIDQLQEMVEFTYSVWFEVLAERAAKLRKAS
jgi:hypothetical protein